MDNMNNNNGNQVVVDHPPMDITTSHLNNINNVKDNISESSLSNNLNNNNEISQNNGCATSIKADISQDEKNNDPDLVKKHNNNHSSPEKCISFNYSAISTYGKSRPGRSTENSRLPNPRMVGDILQRVADSTRVTDYDKLVKSMKKKKTSENIQNQLVIREIKPDDQENVCNLLYDNFRSLTGHAMLYWIIQHAYDLCIIIAINFILMPPKRVSVFTFLFILYLFLRARIEIEKHIRYNCPDLKNIYNTYKMNERSNFWITELPYELKKMGDDSSSLSRSASPSGIDSGDENLLNNITKKGIDGEESNVLGCVGITPHRGSNEVAQMVRLVVKRGCRSMRVGSRLLMQVEKYAREVGYKEIRIYTNNLNTEYMHFVKQNGYELFQIVRRGLMRGDLLIWSKYIDTESPTSYPSNPEIASATFIAE